MVDDAMEDASGEKYAINKYPGINHRVNDPLRLKEAVFKYISVHTANGKIYKGWLKTIDPVSGSIVLVNFKNDKPDTVDIIMGNAYKSAEVIHESSANSKLQLENLFSGKQKMLSKVEMQEKKEKLKSWLIKNRLPVKEMGEDTEILQVTEALKIMPPYDVEHCQSTNEIILGKIHMLIATMPEDEDSSDSSD